MTRQLEKTLYHSVLRVLVCVFALMLVFDSGLLYSATSTLSDSTQNYVAAAIGVKVGVAPNELNVLTAKITELEQELAVKDREIAVNLNQSTPTPGFDQSTFVLSLILFILLALIVMNYVLDFLRSRTSLPTRAPTKLSPKTQP